VTGFHTFNTSRAQLTQSGREAAKTISKKVDEDKQVEQDCQKGFFLNENPQKPRQNESRVDTGRTNQLKDGSPRHFQEPPKIPLGHVINFRSEFPCCVCRKILGKIPISIAEKWNVYNQREKKTTTTTTTRHSNANVK
jgi:hypothetical protein